MFCPRAVVYGFVIAGLAAPAWAGSQLSGAAYLGLCGRHSVRTGVPAAATLDDAAVREVRGVVEGLTTVAATETQPAGFTLLLKDDTGGTLSLSGTGDVPSVSPEMRVRALVQPVEAVNSNQPNDELLGFAMEVDVRLALQPHAGAGRRASGRVPSRVAATRGRPLSSRSLGVAGRPDITPPEIMQASIDPGVFAAYRHAVSCFNRRLTPQQLDTITATLLSYSLKYGVDARLIMAVVVCESDFKLGETSHSGAMGLGQLMPSTARALGVTNAYDPVQNLEASIRLLRSHLARHADKDWWQQLQLALADYNAGPGAVKKYGGVPPYHETRNYIVKVARWYQYFLTGK